MTALFTWKVNKVGDATGYKEQAFLSGTFQLYDTR